MTRLVLHIGGEKTGTTSIQEFLVLNRARLQEQGFHVPEFLGPRTHRWAAFMAENESRCDGFARRLGLADSAERRQEKKQEIRQRLMREVGLQPERTWIISSEHLQSRLTTPEEVVRLRDILAGLFDPIRIVVYLRDPLATAISYWSMRVKGGAVITELGPPVGFGRHICDHQRILERWLSVFDADQLEVRLFQEADFVGADLISDFCHATGINAGEDLQRPPRMNETLSYQAIKLLARVNQQIPDRIGEVINPNRGNIGDYFLSALASHPKYVPTRSERDIYTDFYRDSEQWLRQRFFPERHRLWSEATIREDDDPRFSRELSALEASVVDLVVGLWQGRQG